MSNCKKYAVWICDDCVEGKGGECHTPGCLFFLMDAPTVSVKEIIEEQDIRYIKEQEEKVWNHRKRFNDLVRFNKKEEFNE